MQPSLTTTTLLGAGAYGAFWGAVYAHARGRRPLPAEVSRAAAGEWGPRPAERRARGA